MPGLAIAPYAQAAAVVNGDGTVVRSQGVVNVTRTMKGEYTVEVEPSIDMANAVPIAIMRADGKGMATFCVYTDNSTTFRLTCRDPNHQAQDSAFHVIVP
ncbi:hypothetical protein [Streptomyces sp. NPDC046161]|uniref:hypothetical protein n=1 Tax=Streptomyces sp. NPDC046161 TaxID=3155132 RepID=UPI0033DB4B4D